MPAMHSLIPVALDWYMYILSMSRHTFMHGHLGIALSVIESGTLTDT